MGLYQELSGSIDSVIAAYKQSRTDGKTSFSEVMTLVYNASATFVKLIEGVSGKSGVEKKEVVLEAVGKFYDEVIAPIDISGIPNLVEGMVDSAIRALIMTLVGSWIDAVVNIFNKIGWGLSDAVAPAAVLQGPLIF
jgi:hypothetical protein